MHHRAVGDGDRSIPATLALVPILQAREGNAGILARAREGKARHREDEVHIRLFMVEIILRHILCHFQRLGLGGAGGKVDQVQDGALVLVGKKAGGQPHEQDASTATMPA